MKKTMLILMVLMMAGSALWASGNKEEAAAPGSAYGRGPGMMGGRGGFYGQQPPAEGELPEAEEVNLTGVFTFEEGIPTLTADGKKYSVMVSPYVIAAEDLVSEGDTVTIEGLLIEPFEDCPIESEGHLRPGKVTVGNQTYILPGRGAPGAGGGPRGGQGGGRGRF